MWAGYGGGGTSRTGSDWKMRALVSQLRTLDSEGCYEPLEDLKTGMTWKDDFSSSFR